MIRPLEDTDVEFIRLHYKIGNKELGQLMGTYKCLVKDEANEIRNLCFYECDENLSAYLVIRCYGTSDDFIDYLNNDEGQCELIEV